MTNKSDSTLIILFTKENFHKLVIDSEVLLSHGFKGDYKSKIEFKDIYAKKTVLISMGEEALLSKVRLFEIGSLLAECTKKIASVNLEVCASKAQEFIINHVLMSLRLSNWRFDKYLSSELKYKNKPKLSTINLISKDADILRDFYEYDAMVKGINLARYFINEPASTLTPKKYVEEIFSLADENLTIEVLHKQDLERLNMGALLSVSKGSDFDPYVAVLQYTGDKGSDRSIAFVGKGVTFDTGGYSLKPATAMLGMKKDMAGSASVIGLMKSLSLRKAKVNAIGIVGIVDNCINSKANKPGDIVYSMGGKSIEILNTDAEGRLVLADLLTYTQRYFAPEVIVDIATLTGAIIMSLGEERAGLFTNDSLLGQQLFVSGESVGERMWHMPMGDEYKDYLKSNIADLQNISLTMKGGGAVFAAMFLKEFIEGKTKWAHLDIAGTSNLSKSGSFNAAGLVAFGVLGLNEYIKNYWENYS